MQKSPIDITNEADLRKIVSDTKAPVVILFMDPNCRSLRSHKDAFHEVGDTLHKKMRFKRVDIGAFPQALKILRLEDQGGTAFRFFKKGLLARDLGGTFDLEKLKSEAGRAINEKGLFNRPIREKK